MNKEKKFSPHDYTPRRFGLKYSPTPQIVLEYIVPSSGKLYHHKMRLPKLKSDSNLTDVMKELYEKHYLYLDSKKVNPNQIVRLIEKLKSNLKSGRAANKEVSPPKKNDINELDDVEDDSYYKFDDYQNEDLNKLTTEELQKKKQDMEILYRRNSINPEDNDFQYDVRKDFEAEDYEAEWDNELDASY